MDVECDRWFDIDNGDDDDNDDDDLYLKQPSIITIIMINIGILTSRNERKAFPLIMLNNGKLMIGF